MALEELPNPSKLMRQNICRQQKRFSIKNLKSSVIVFVGTCVHCVTVIFRFMNIKVQNPVVA